MHDQLVYLVVENKVNGIYCRVQEMIYNSQKCQILCYVYTRYDSNIDLFL